MGTGRKTKKQSKSHAKVAKKKSSPEEQTQAQKNQKA